MAKKRPQAKDVDYYLKLPYAIELRQYGDGTWFARVPDLPGCMTEADTVEETMVMIKDAMAGWVEVALSEGIPISEPSPQDLPASQTR